MSEMSGISGVIGMSRGRQGSSATVENGGNRIENGQLPQLQSAFVCGQRDSPSRMRMEMIMTMRSG
jgi:hypothetical protein